VDGLVSERFHCVSKDGTRIPLFVLRRKDVPLDGRAPTLLYGYGGFRVGLYPSFSRSRGVWAERGGVFVVANLRGGDEFGERWHEQGSREAQQNCFDDFIAAADWLVSTGKARRERLAIEGGSNGGLLVAAVVNQRPDLCRAAISSVPLTDMLRFHRFQYAKSWTQEYGDPDVAEQYRWIRPYSPYHNVREGAALPAVLLTAGLEDGRVNAFHARKMAARWQAASPKGRPVLLRIDRKGGHGAANLTRALEEIADEWTFLHLAFDPAP
jgi:prolyl oligopeptidase